MKHEFPNKISVCMIAKDEEKTIKKCLDSITFADEIIVNDTGSTDNTLDILFENGVKVISSRWNNNFSEARNLSLKHARYGWVLWCDADDYFPPDTCERINEIKNEPLDSFIYFNVVNTINGLPIGHKFMQCRMFPNSAAVYFENPVHERVSPSAKKRGLIPVGYPSVKIHHTGYEDVELKAKKAQRNIDLIKNIKDHEMSYEWMRHLGISYMSFNIPEAYKHFLKASFINETADIFSKLGNCQIFLENFDNAIRHYSIGLSIDPDHLSLNYHIAYCYELTGVFDKAITHYKKVLAKPDDITFSAVPFDQPRIYTFHYLLRIYTAFDMIFEAVDLVNQINLMYPKHRLENVIV